MNTQNAAVALRFIIVAAVTGVPGDSLDQLSSYELPDGMLVSVIANQAIYRLDKSGTAATSGTSVVSPGAGPGIFNYVTGTSGSPLTAQVSGTASLTGTTAETDDTWVNLPAGTGFYTSNDGDAWTVSTTSGILTYAGPSGRHFRVSVSATVASAVAGQSVEIASSVNAALVGTTTFVPSAGVANVSPTTVNLGSHVLSETLVGLNAGDTIAAIVRDTSASNNITVSHMNMVILPV